ncbi:MAG TPA: non-homologous end-joining DNA ligase [Propionibacteriaceae bacterium]|nr:non-homologous end-joining DNA ligase [Propionibacteriaceae bacterium]
MPAQNEVRVNVGERTLTLTNLDKVLYPASGFTKAEVVQYYLAIAPTMLPHLAGRCLTRIRFPNGVDKGSFYEKNLPSGAPPWLGRDLVAASGETISYVTVSTPEELVLLANLASLELHAPQWVVDDTTRRADGAVIMEGLDEPRATTLMVDLDPGTGITMVDSSHAAMIVATSLAELGLLPYVKTTGSKGLQISAAIAPTPSEQVTDWVKQFSQRLATQQPDRFVVTMAKDQRVGRIYLDYLQNKAARNTIAAYSMRAREYPSVATPLLWDEVAAVTSPDDLRFSPADVLARIEEHGDLFADVLTRDGPELPLLEA